MSDLDFSNYLSPFSWRYGSSEMRKIFSEEYKYELWRRIWVAIAEAQSIPGIVSKKELLDLKSQEKNIEVKRIIEIEKETKHDVVSAIKEFAEKAKIGGAKIHLGATSMDIVDNADFIRNKEALVMVERKLKNILRSFGNLIEKYADTPTLGYTHLQPAEPTTVGYRFAFYAQDILIDLEQATFVMKTIKAKGLKGAVGTGAGYTEIFKDKKMTYEQFEKHVMDSLGIEAALISTQVATRKYDYMLVSSLASIASSLSKFAADLRILQSPMIGEWAESFGKSQVGSSAMPFKRNPINAEKICSLSRFLQALPQVALENATLSYLERTLDDSANKRIIMPEAFLLMDEILETSQKILDGIAINNKKIKFNLLQFAPFSATEGILIAAVQNGADRQEMHEVLREISMNAWGDVQSRKENSMENLLLNNKKVNEYIDKKRIRELLDVTHHVGNAPMRARKLVRRLRSLSS